MKQIKLLNLRLHNFKGIKDLEIDFGGNNAVIYGANEAGKTTVFDAFVWLLFNKDSSDRSDFEIKTMENDKVIHHLDHEVESTLLVDNKELNLKKVFREKWTKPRGQIDHVFGGHETKYYINGVPSKKREYDDTIAGIIDEDVFKLLTNPNEFNVNLHWTKRRDLLFDIAGNVTEEEVLSSDKKFKVLQDSLNGNSIDDHKKIIAEKRKEINERIKEIPTRIDEINRNMPNVDGLNEVEIKASIGGLETNINSKREQINNIKNGSEVNEIKKKISDIDLQIANVKNEHTQNEQDALFKLKMRLQEEESNHEILQGEVRGHMQRKEHNEREITNLEQQMSNLRDEYVRNQGDINVWKEREFEHNDDDCVCPTCKQDLPENQVDEAVAKFNKNKADTLEKIKERQEEINEEGITLKKKVESLNKESESVQGEIERITGIGKKKVEEIELLKKKIEKAESQVTPIEENAEYIKLNEEKQSLENQIKELEQSVESSVNEVTKEIEALKERQRELQADLAKIEQVNNSKERIEELKGEERSLAAEFEELEHQLYLTEEFTRAKVEMLTDNINSKFKHARFRLFEEQINGGLNETCLTIGKNGESYDSINNAFKINVSLDIINTLSEHYGVQAPIFIDNAESVTKLIDIDSQVISLVVSADDKELRVETEAKEESEVA